MNGAAELARSVRSRFSRVEPDIIHISNLFEGLVDNAITSVGAFALGNWQRQSRLTT